MKNIISCMVLVLGLNLNGCSKNVNDSVKENNKEIKMETEGTYTVIEVTHGGESLGSIVLELYIEKTPVTVQNFIGLAEGTREFTDLKTSEKVKRPFYNGLIFHRVIPEFMIQGGDPLGNGRGGPGYKFKDEIVPELKFDTPGLLAMANAGPGTNGSQFFVTVAPTPWLNGKHTIFGKVVEGMDIVMKISEVQADRQNMPLKPVVMKKLTIKKETKRLGDWETGN